MPPPRSATSAALNKSIERLGGEAAAVSPASNAATAAEPVSQSEESASLASAPSAADLAIGWSVFKVGAGEEAETEHRPHGVVVDVALVDDEEAVVVARVRAKNRRQDAFFETWLVSEIDMALSCDPGTSKKAQAAKKLCGAIYESMQSGHWGDKNEALLMAACRLTAEMAGRRVA